MLGGNVDLEPEERWISEITYERRFWGDGVVSIGYRHDEIANVIDRIPLDGGLSAVGNIGDATLDRLSVNLTIPTDRLGITGGQFGFRNDWNSHRGHRSRPPARPAPSPGCAPARRWCLSPRTSPAGS